MRNEAFGQSDWHARRSYDRPSPALLSLFHSLQRGIPDLAISEEMCGCSTFGGKSTHDNSRRQLLRRPGYDVDVEDILSACAEHGVAVEINANPWRLDLDWRWHQKAIDLGCWFSVNPDAHSTAEIDLTKGGVAMARKGGVSPDRVLNALDLTAFRAHIEARKRSKLRENLGPSASVPSF